MESWFQRIFLALLASIVWANTGLAQSASTPESDVEVLESIIKPDIERRVIDEDLIDAEDFEFGLYGGVLSVEDFGTADTYGARFAYHITEDWFFESTVGATKTQETSFELLTTGNAGLLSEEQRRLVFYNLSLGLNLLPGEVFLGRKHAFNTSYYIIAGLGNTQFAGDSYFTINFGGGFRFFATDWLALRVDFRNHLFEHTIFGEQKSVQNLEALLGASIYF